MRKTLLPLGGLMCTKITIAGHPLYSMLVAFPVAIYTGAPAGFAV